MDLRIIFAQLYQLLYSKSHKQKIPENGKYINMQSMEKTSSNYHPGNTCLSLRGLDLNRFKLEQCLIPKLFVFIKKKHTPQRSSDITFSQA